MFIATLVAKDRLSAGDVSTAMDALRGIDADHLGEAWLDEGKAADIAFSGDARAARAVLEALPGEIDAIVQIAAMRRRRLIVADMDSTMIGCECIDELADYAGIKPQIAEITEAAMRGELDFEAALKARVALLAGLDEARIEQCLAERVHITPGARELIGTVRANGGYTILVSGGFTRFAEPVAAQIGFDEVVANRLGIRDGALTGMIEGSIVGAEAKRATLLEALAAKGWSSDDAMAIGDGANDIPMIEAAGLGVAFHAKPKTVATASAAVRHGDLSVLLYAVGYRRGDWTL